MTVAIPGMCLGLFCSRPALTGRTLCHRCAQEAEEKRRDIAVQEEVAHGRKYPDPNVVIQPLPYVTGRRLQQELDKLTKPVPEIGDVIMFKVENREVYGRVKKIVTYETETGKHITYNVSNPQNINTELSDNAVLKIYKEKR